MSTNWKDIGMNSGNMKQHRNVTSNRVNYENGKWDSVYDISGIESKGYTFDISGQNIVVGIGTDKPFSRLSLGSNQNSGEFSPTKPGQLAAIALNEEFDGGSFNGLFYNTDISGQSRNADNISGIQLMSSVNGFDVTDLSNGQLIVGSDNVVTIGGRPRIGNESYNNSIPFLPGTHGDRKIVLDTRGSIRTDGYINFYNKTSNSFEPYGDTYDAHADIPVGSLFLTGGGANNVCKNAGLYFKKSNTNTNADIVEITGGGGGGGGGGSGTGSTLFDGSLNNLVVNSNGNYIDYPYIIQKNNESTLVGGVPITFSGGAWNKQDASGVIGFQNALTIRQGHLSVVTLSGENIKIQDPVASSLLSAFQGISGGIIFAEKQLLLGTTPDDPTTNQTPENGYLRSGYAIIDAQTVDETATILSYNFKHGGTTAIKYNPAKASNSIILLKKDINEDGNTTGSSKGCVIGKTFDASNSIVIGGRFGEISTPNSLISHPIDQGYCDNDIIDPSGCNIVFGYKNTLKYTPNSFIMGANNTVDNNESKPIDITSEGGTIVVGSSNAINNNSSNDPINKKTQNVIFGNSNNTNNSENSFIQGKNNVNFGSYNVIFGDSNKLGNSNMGTGLTDYNRYYTTENSFVQGNTNQILAPSGETVKYAFIAGKNNTLDMSFNTFSTNTDYGFTLLGCYAGISGENFDEPHMSNGDIIEDLSNIRFAIGTTEMYNSRTGDDKEIHRGNVFTIDSSGNTHIHGNLIVDGSNVVLRTEYLDVSDNNLSLNYPGTNSPEGGGITILDTATGEGHKGLIWTANGPYGSTNCWDTSGSDISTNNIFAMDISANDISCVDISASNFYGNIYTTTGHSQFNDISTNDISCVDISGVNAFFTGDLSCNGKLYVGGLIDPTGLVLDAQSTIPTGAAGTNKAVIWYDSTNLTKIKLSLDNGASGNIATEAYVSSQVSGGGGASVAATRLTIGLDPINLDTRHLLFAASTGGFQDVSGASNLRCNPSNGKIIATTFVGALTGTASSVDGDVTVGSGKTIKVQNGTLTTSAAQNKAIVEGAAADVDIGAYKLTAQTLVSDVATGTAPLTVTSTTVVPNLHASEVTGNVTVGSGKTLNVSNGTLTTSAAQSQAIVSGEVKSGTTAPTSVTPDFTGQIYVDTTNSSEKIYVAHGTTQGDWTEPGGGSSFDPANPGAIGGNSPGTGAFTSLSASGTVTVGDDSAFTLQRADNTSGVSGVFNITGQQAYDDSVNLQAGGDVSITGGAGANLGNQGEINITGKNVKINGGFGFNGIGTPGGVTISDSGKIETDGSIHAEGGLIAPLYYQTATNDITLNTGLTFTTTDPNQVYLVKPGSGATTITLPNQSSMNNKFGYRFKFIVENNSQNVIIQTENGTASLIFKGYAFVTDTSNNTTQHYKAITNATHLELLNNDNYTGGIIEMVCMASTTSGYWFVEAQLFTDDAPEDPWKTNVSAT